MEAWQESQQKANLYLQDNFAIGSSQVVRRFELDKVQEPVLWAKDPQDALELVKKFQSAPELQINFLSDLTAYDNADKKEGAGGRFVVVIQLLSTLTKVRLRIKTMLTEGQPMLSLTSVWPAANWLEREVFDMFGITFEGHPDLRRILMDERFHGFPLRKEYPYKQREPFSDNVKINLDSKDAHS